MKMAVWLDIYFFYSSQKEYCPQGNTVRTIYYDYSEKKEYVGIHTQPDELMMKIK